ncbi:BamA/TamA family outer membrane protein [Telluribacter humicola]|uniref:BamA/TamA family outer membrane protein n=1 Tax=Telluribacter humicola TaxID=1720261 RepID=UPI001A95A304|nr:BamA/TamA family outer membrane protein [Telluribacter humicola]
MKIGFWFLVMIVCSPWAMGAVQDTLQPQKREFLRDKTIVPVPVVFRLPETGFGAGAVVASTFSFARDSVGAKPSQLSFGVTYTQKKQILVFLPFTIFYDNNRYYFSGDNGWYKYNYFYYGIGEDRIEQEIFDVQYPRVRLLASRLVAPNTYLGLRYQYEGYNVTGTRPGGELASGRIEGSDFSRTSGLGLSILRDTRDIVFYPRRGIFAEAYVLPTSRIFGADRNFTRYYLDLSHYKSLHKKVVLATNYVASATVGDRVPFSQLSFLGGQKKMRGVYEGFFRDKNALIGQAEARWEVWRFIGLVGFGAVGVMGDEKDIIRLNKPKYTYGVGLRVTAQKKNHLNIRIDYGMSPYGHGNLYATIGEAF